MALINIAQLSRDGLLAQVATRVRGVAHDGEFQRVIRQQGWRFLVVVTTEARAAWLRAGPQ